LATSDRHGSDEQRHRKHGCPLPEPPLFQTLEEGGSGHGLTSPSCSFFQLGEEVLDEDE
jgi:hypothetical protein